MSEPSIRDYADIYRLGQSDERYRVIKLLEGLIDTRPTETVGTWRGYSLERVIEIIKEIPND